MSRWWFEEHLGVRRKPHYIDQVFATFRQQIAALEMLKAHILSSYHKVAVLAPNAKTHSRRASEP
jgi:hypothetical protein